MKLVMFGIVLRNTGANHEIEQILQKVEFGHENVKSSKCGQNSPNLGENDEIDHIWLFSSKSRCKQ